MSKKLPFSRSLCPFCTALEREQNSVDSKISAGAPGLRGTGKRSGKGARFPSAWREQALVSSVSMDRGKQISPFKANHAVLEGTHWRQCALGSGAAGKELGGHGKAEGRRATKGQEPVAMLLLRPSHSSEPCERCWDALEHQEQPKEAVEMGQMGHTCVFLFCVVSSFSTSRVRVCVVKEHGSTEQLPDLPPSPAFYSQFLIHSTLKACDPGEPAPSP